MLQKNIRNLDGWKMNKQLHTSPTLCLGPALAEVPGLDLFQWMPLAQTCSIEVLSSNTEQLAAGATLTQTSSQGLRP
ncbi:hypothetical protein LEMLEM_LOCUS12359, partial [Lemmus lemmus]